MLEANEEYKSGEVAENTRFIRYIEMCRYSLTATEHVSVQHSFNDAGHIVVAFSSK